MRKYLLATVLVILFVCFMEPAENLLSKFLRLEQPTVHQIQEGEWLSKIAQEYYGDASYWRELKLINRAPDGDSIYPGEEIVVPSFAVVERIRHTRRLSEVNQLVREQQDILAGKSPASQGLRTSLETEITKEIVQDVEESFVTVTPTEMIADDDQHNQAAAVSEPVSSVSQFLLVGIGLLIAVFVAGIFLYTRRKKEDVAYYSTPEDVTEVDEENADLTPNIFLELAGERSSASDGKRETAKKGEPVV